MSYDANGNILSLSRKGKTGANSWGDIDQLSYVYESNSNKIKKVSDLQGLSNQNVGDFRDSSNVATEYEYWQDGSLKIDRNKKISQIDYNHLKLPRQITFEGGQWIKNQYDATGKKLKSTTSDGIIYDFVGNTIYKNGTLYQISHDEGRLVNGNYEYDIKDHLGNLRVSFRDSSGIAKIVTKLDYDPWGLTLKGLDYSNPNFTKNNFQYGSKEKVETFGLNWIDFGARFYMPDVPHFTTLDPLAEKMPSWAPYTYTFDNSLKYIDSDGRYPIQVITRSYAPFKTFGPGNQWYGDNRGHTLANGASYRTSATINYDTETRKTSVKGGSSRSHTVDGSKDAYSVTNVSDRSQGNNLDTHSYGNNAAQMGSWDIDQFTKLNVSTVGNIKKDHILNVSGTISGDDFPNQESIISDSKGNKLWLGNFETSGDRQMGPVTDLPFTNEGDINIKVNVSISVDKNGVFQGIMVNENGKQRIISIAEWNKQFNSNEKK